MDSIRHGNHKLNDDSDGYMYKHYSTNSQNFNSHIHKCHEFLQIVKGKLLYIVEGSEYMLCEGDLIITKPDELHSFSFPEECVYQRRFIHIYPGILKRFPELEEFLLSRENGMSNHIPAEFVQKHGINTIFDEIEKYCAEPVSETDLMVMTYTYQLIAKIIVILSNETLPSRTYEKNTCSDCILSYVDRHYRENITLASIAEHMHLSAMYLSHKFKQETGMTIKTYINLRRITAAKDLISEGRKATSVYDKCGYSDYSAFYRSFTKYVGMTPNAYKHQYDNK